MHLIYYTGQNNASKTSTQKKDMYFYQPIDYGARPMKLPKYFYPLLKQRTLEKYPTIITSALK
jgi:hypothetical protein